MYAIAVLCIFLFMYVLGNVGQPSTTALYGRIAQFMRFVIDVLSFALFNETMYYICY